MVSEMGYRMPALDWISIEGFRSIGRIDRLALLPINVLIGANGSGKSNFINLFSFLREIRDGRLQHYVATAGGADRVLHFGTGRTSRLRIALSFGGETNQYNLTLSPTADGALVPTSETVLFGTRRADPFPHETLLSPVQREAGISRDSQPDVARSVQDHLDGWRVYHFHDTSGTAPLRRPAQLADNRHLRTDGSNLPAFLYRLKAQCPGEYRLIRAIVQRVAPFFDDFVLDASALNPEVIRLEWRHKGSDAFFDASSLSDGTLRFVALATLLLQPARLRPSVILVDEPELGLHPYAITLLASMIKQAAVDSQVILSTQSPLLLDNFQPDDVLVADRVGGGTTIRRLSNHDLEDWLEKYSLGQLWEAGEFNGRPNVEA